MIKVRCVFDSNSKHFLEVGKVYEVDETTYIDHYVINDRTFLKSRFEVVKDEEQMTHRQKIKELLPIIQAYCDGAEVEYECGMFGWIDAGQPAFSDLYQYRIKQTPDTIDWSHVHEDYKFMARNMNGRAYFHTQRPDKKTNRFNSMHSAAVSQSSYKQGTVSWENSLVERPEGV